MQTKRLTKEKKKTGGGTGIFGSEAQSHDHLVSYVSKQVFLQLQQEYPSLNFRYRKGVTKAEINRHLHEIDQSLGRILYVPESSIKPDGGIVEVEDDSKNWRVVLVSEAKRQGKDIENIKSGIMVGKKNDRDLMVAGNAIERAYKNIFEISNFMLTESYFPYVLFLEGTNFLTTNLEIKRPDNRIVKLDCHSGTLNRLDRLTAANYGMDINQNLCQNKFVKCKDKTIMLQSTSIYTSGNGEKWKDKDMFDIMMSIAKTSIKILASDLFEQLVRK